MSVSVNLGTRSYPIHIGSGLLSDTAQLKSAIVGSQVMIVSNQTIACLFLEPLIEQLQGLGLSKLDTCLLPEGEEHKTLETVNLIYSRLLEAGHNRQTQLLALGGGVVGDMTGFAAATYQRGVDFIQIPTTLLAQVDSSVGGKTGVNHSLGKNMIGAFYQPKSVLIDIDTLKSLPAREVSAGLAEIVKYALLGDESFLEWIEAHSKALCALDSSILTHAIARSCRMKAEIVAQDEREAGVRALLNLGHTFGHAVESWAGYGVWLHGEAVALGLLMACDLSARMGHLEHHQVERVKAVLLSLQLPVKSPHGMTSEDFFEYMARDKKVQNQQLRFIVLKSLGAAFVCDDVPRDLLLETIAAVTP